VALRPFAVNELLCQLLVELRNKSLQPVSSSFSTSGDPRIPGSNGFMVPQRVLGAKDKHNASKSRIGLLIDD
jgi:hypothetical protein